MDPDTLAGTPIYLCSFTNTATTPYKHYFCITENVDVQEALLREDLSTGKAFPSSLQRDYTLYGPEVFIMQVLSSFSTRSKAIVARHQLTYGGYDVQVLGDVRIDQKVYWRRWSNGVVLPVRRFHVDGRYR